VRINGKTHYLWRAVDHEGEVLEVFATKRRDRKAALRFLKRVMKRYGQPKWIVTDRLRSYKAAMVIIGNAGSQVVGKWLNNRAENSHQPFRRREGAMAKFKDVKTLQNYIPERSKVLPRRISGTCAKHQRMLMQAIKRARMLALIPFTSD